MASGLFRLLVSHGAIPESAYYSEDEYDGELPRGEGLVFQNKLDSGVRWKKKKKEGWGVWVQFDLLLYYKTKAILEHRRKRGKRK